jgi:hypothetical protein
MCTLAPRAWCRPSRAMCRRPHPPVYGSLASLAVDTRAVGTSVGQCSVPREGRTDRSSVVHHAPRGAADTIPCLGALASPLPGAVRALASPACELESYPPPPRFPFLICSETNRVAWSSPLFDGRHYRL